MFVWMFHRISGLLLIVLLFFQLVTGFHQASSSNAESVKVVAALHKHELLVSLLVFLVIYHGLYGLRTILLDLGLKREKLLFWLCTAGGLILFLAFLVGYYTSIAA